MKTSNCLTQIANFINLNHKVTFIVKARISPGSSENSRDSRIFSVNCVSKITSAIRLGQSETYSGYQSEFVQFRKSLNCYLN